MKIGVRSHDFGRMNEQKLAQTIKEAGFDSVQLAMTKAIEGIENFQSIEPSHLYRIKEAFEKADLEINVLGCYIEPSIIDKQKRLEQVAFFQQGIIHAKELGVSIVGTETTHFYDEEPREQAYERLKDSVLRMVEVAEKHNVMVGIEPVAEHTLNTSMLTRRLLDEVGSSKLKVIFDPVNLLLPSTYEKQDEIFEETFRRLGADIVVVHLKDVVMNQGVKEWRNIGKGIVHYPPIFKWLQQFKPDIHILREHVKMDSYQLDIEAMKNLISEGTK